MRSAQLQTIATCLMVAGLTCLNGAVAQDERKLKTINALAADKHKGEDCRVIFVVNQSSPGPIDPTSPEKPRELVNLYAMQEWDNPKSFWVVLTHEAITGLRQDGIKDPLTYFNRKLVRVDGKIAKVPHYNMPNMSIVVTDPAQIEVQTIGASAADKHEGQICKVGFTVNLASAVNEGKAVNLHSMKQWEDPKSFWVTITPVAVKAFRKLGINDPAVHYDGKRIRVEGKIIKAPDGKLLLFVEEPAQIEILAREGK